MNEVRFRAWDNENDRYIYSDDSDFSCLLHKSGKVVFYYNDGHDWVEMYHKEAEQYIGVKDANRREVYEGDIVKSWAGVHPVVRHGAKFVLKHTENDFFDVPHHLFIKVLGNIHENPELLEATK